MTDQEILHWFHHSYGIEKEILADYLADHSRDQESNIVRAIGQYEQKKFNFKSIVQQTLSINPFIPEETAINVLTPNLFSNNRRNIYLKPNGDLICNDQILHQNIKEINSSVGSLIAIANDGYAYLYDHDFNRTVRSNIKQMTRGFNHKTSLLKNGKVKCDLKRKPKLNNAIQIASGNHHSIALTSNGIPHAWGDGIPDISHIKNVVQVQATWTNCFLLHYDGTLTVITTQKRFKLELHNIIQIMCQDCKHFALTLNGNLFSFSITNKPELYKTNVFKVNATPSHTTILESL